MAIPIGIYGGYSIEHAYHTFDDVVDVGEVANHVAVVVNIDGRVFQYAFGEFKQRHIGAAPWSINGEKTQAGGG